MKKGNLARSQIPFGYCNGVEWGTRPMGLCPSVCLLWGTPGSATHSEVGRPTTPPSSRPACPSPIPLRGTPGSVFHPGMGRPPDACLSSNRARYPTSAFDRSGAPERRANPRFSLGGGLASSSRPFGIPVATKGIRIAPDPLCFHYGSEWGTRTPTGFPTTPSD